MTMPPYPIGDLVIVHAEARQVRHSGWVNVYRWFSSGFIWPRGIPARMSARMPKNESGCGLPRSCRMPGPAGTCERLTRRGRCLAAYVRSGVQFQLGAKCLVGARLVVPIQ